MFGLFTRGASGTLRVVSAARAGSAFLLLLTLFNANAAWAQTSCAVNSASANSSVRTATTVTRGSTNNVVLSPTIASAAGCASTTIAKPLVGPNSNVNDLNNVEQPDGTVITLASGSTFTKNGSNILYTPSASAGSTETISIGSTSGGKVTMLYDAGFLQRYDLTVTLVAPNAPTAALTSLSPTSFATGGISTVTVTLTNPNSTAALAGVANAITLPSGVVVAATPAANSTCGGSITATGGASSVSISGGSLAASATCTITFNITSVAAATYAIPSGTPSATGANAGSAGTNATLTVTSTLPGVTSVSPAVGLPAGGTPVTINGVNFTGATAVMFGANAATGVTVVSATSIMYFIAWCFVR